MRLATIVQNVYDIIENHSGVEFDAYNYDTLAWYYYWVAEVEYTQGKNQARQSIQRAMELMDMCFSWWSTKLRDIENAHEIWRVHSRMIKTLKAKIDSLDKELS